MRPTILVSTIALISLAISSSAFTAAPPTGTKSNKKRVTFQPARVVQASQYRGRMYRMSEEKEAEAFEVTEQKSVTKDAAGNYYDDEVEPIPASKKGISDSMKERLIREASAGLDSEKKQTNVLLYIMLGVAVLVIAGGQGIFY